ncbi:hypothetical protein DRF67_18700 [Chryseobacterium pennipullorum]|uniref:Uncharacterized protein n=1 Tax=Chryseobacterium pennipullorum TaxID=2258963 RepID=A0A3D9AR06_9FLAO|nr:hypothetical protein DRF67_18700 [Chryseobacterium pennipullorum]
MPDLLDLLFRLVLLLLFLGFFVEISFVDGFTVEAEKLLGNNNPSPKRLVRSSFFIVIVFYYL